MRGFPGGSDGEESTCNAGDLGSIPGSERSPGEGNGNPLQEGRGPFQTMQGDRLSCRHQEGRRGSDEVGDSRGERSPWLPLETRPDSPGEPSPLLMAIGESIPLHCLEGSLAFPAHLRMKPASLGNLRLAPWVVPHAERPRFPCPLLKRCRQDFFTI